MPFLFVLFVLALAIIRISALDRFRAALLFLQEDGKKRMQADDNRTAGDLSNGALEFSAVPQSNVFIVTAREQAVLLLWTAGNAAHSSLVTLPASCSQQGLSRHPIETQGAAYSTHIAIRWGTAIAVLHMRRCRCTHEAMLSISCMHIAKQKMLPMMCHSWHPYEGVSVYQGGGNRIVGG